MNYYKITVYIPYDGHKDLILSHEEEFDDLEFHSIIQDIIDETIMDHAQRASNIKRYCHWDYWNLFGKDNFYRFGLFLSNKGFDVVHPIETVTIKDKPILSDERYKNIEIPSCEGKCFKEEDDRDCPLVCKRIKENK